MDAGDISTGQTDADKQEFRAEGLSQPANACTHYTMCRPAEFLSSPEFVLHVCKLGPCHCAKQTLTSFCAPVQGVVINALVVG